MVATLGNVALYVGLAGSVLALVSYFIGISSKEKRYLSAANTLSTVVALCTTIASAALVYLLLSSDFSIQYVYEYTSSDLSPLYKLSAFWAGQPGSLLLWLWLHTIFAALVTNSGKPEDAKVRNYASAIMAGISFFFFLIVGFGANPFVPMAQVVSEGQGLNPLLQNFGMVIHPVTLYLGYVGFAVPYAFALAALLAKDTTNRWLKVARPWALVAWGFLSIGMIYGGQWAYVELGWGGYWAWDPVENASLFPWLVGTAFFHSAMMQERKGLLKGWTVGLVIMAYTLAIFGTFLTRSGILQSVHAFPANPLMTAIFLSLIIVVLGFGILLMITRRKLFKAPTEIDEYTSKEGTFLLNNLVLSGAAFGVVLGTMFPWLTKVLTGRQIETGKGFFNTFSIPLAVVLLVVIGICTRVSWKKREGEANVPQDVIWNAVASAVFAVILWVLGVHNLWALLPLAGCFFVLVSLIVQVVSEVGDRMRRAEEDPFTAFGWLVTKQRRRMGAYVVHLAVVMMIVGFSGNAFNLQVQKTLQTGQSISLGGYTMTFQGLQQQQRGRVTLVYAPLTVTRNGRAYGFMSPAVSFHPDYANTGEGEKNSAEVAVKGDLVSDFYIILSSWGQQGTDATFKVLVNYLVNWVWIGMWTLVFGTLLVLWPQAPVPAPAAAVVKAAKE